jgi:hypothetical protein
MPFVAWATRMRARRRWSTVKPSDIDTATYTAIVTSSVVVSTTGAPTDRSNAAFHSIAPTNDATATGPRPQRHAISTLAGQNSRNRVTTRTSRMYHEIATVASTVSSASA